MIEIPSYSGDSVFQEVQPSKLLIQGVLWEDDLVMLLGSEKAGKSILSLQMVCALTTATKFLDKYDVPESVNVLYVQTEGKRSQVPERLGRMANTLPFDRFKFIHIPKKFLPLDSEEYFRSLISAIDSQPLKPKVIFIDALYMAMSGDLIDNQHARLFLSKVAFIMDRYKATVVLVHHESREVMNEKYEIVERGDKASYGSVFFRAIVDHILYLKMNRDKSRTLSCDTQRSGEVMQKEELILIQPDPLCFEIKGDYRAFEEIVKFHIESSNSNGITKDQLINSTKLSASSIEKATRHLLKDKIIIKTSSNPAIFSNFPTRK